MSFETVTPEILAAHLTPELDRTSTLADRHLPPVAVRGAEREYGPGVIGSTIDGVSGLVCSGTTCRCQDFQIDIGELEP